MLFIFYTVYVFNKGTLEVGISFAIEGRVYTPQPLNGLPAPTHPPCQFFTNDQKLLDIGGTILHNKGSDKQKKGGKYEKNLRIKLWGCYSF